MATTRVKVCCISSVEEAHIAVRLGAAALGLVSEMPSGPGVIPEQLIADIAAAALPYQHGAALRLPACGRLG